MNNSVLNVGAACDADYSIYPSRPDATQRDWREIVAFDGDATEFQSVGIDLGHAGEVDVGDADARESVQEIIA